MLTHERLRQVLIYDKCTGIFTWKINIGNSLIGSIAGHFDKDGYLRIQIDGKIYRSHRLAWLYECGVWPTSGLDHKDTIKTNNKFDNLREANNKKQKFNTGAHSNNRLNSKGIRKLDSGRYQARITGENGLYNIGSFNTLKEAEIAYALEASKIHGEFVHHSIKENIE